MNEENAQQVTSAIRTLVSAIIADIMSKIEPRLAALEQKTVTASDAETVQQMVERALDLSVEDHVAAALDDSDIKDRVDTAIRRAGIEDQVESAIDDADIEGKIADKIEDIDAESLRPVIRDIINAATVKFDL